MKAQCDWFRGALLFIFSTLRAPLNPMGTTAFWAVEHFHPSKGWYAQKCAVLTDQQGRSVQQKQKKISALGEPTQPPRARQGYHVQLQCHRHRHVQYGE